MDIISFIKMHGCGNDFVVLDARRTTITLSRKQICHLSDRHIGVGCDQLIILEPSNVADCQMRIYNSDGSAAESCGNATRCVAWLIMEEQALLQASIQIGPKILHALRIADKIVAVDMGLPKFAASDIPLSSAEYDPSAPPIAMGPLSAPVCVNMGNPHAVFFVDNAEEIDLATLGKQLVNHPIFKEGANINIAQIVSRSCIRLRVYERGSGETLACGSGACASVAAAILRKLTDKVVTVMLPGGNLLITQQDNGSIVMQGEVARVFVGQVSIYC